MLQYLRKELILNGTEDNEFYNAGNLKILGGLERFDFGAADYT